MSGRRSGEPIAEPGWLAERTHRSILVHTIENTTFSGVLMHTAEDGVVLADAGLHTPGAEREVSLGGETFVPRARISFVQIMPAAS